VSVGPYASPRRATLATRLQLGLVLLVILAPVAWMALSSFKEASAVTAYPPRLIFAPTLENYRDLIGHSDFLAYALNSCIVAGGSTLLGLLLGVPAAFAVSYHRITWPANMLLAARMAPGTLYLLPWFVAFSALGLVGSLWALILTHTVITMPMIVWILLPYFDAVPREIYESAVIDGARPPRIFAFVALPLVAPGIVVSTIIAFVFSWNYFLFALVLSSFNSKTLVVAAFNYVGEGVTGWGALLSASVLIALPPVLLAVFVQKWLMAGLARGAVKG
jgi:multiple sugar transport system permease protein